MNYINKIEVIGKTYPGSKVLNKNFIIECSDINIFVGEQGVGKSTILKMLFENNKNLKLTFNDETMKKGVKSYYFNSETDNPRVKDIIHYSNIDGTSKGIGIGNALKARFKSHGEVLKSMIISPLKSSKDSIIILDEPESGLSIRNQFNLINAIKESSKNNCQIFIATHCLPIIESFNVISLEHSKIMNGVDFINLVKSK